MKKIIIKLIVVSFFVVVCFSSCEKKEELKCDCFYYNFDEKICLQQDKNKIFIKFAPDADVEQLRNIINRENSLRLTSDYNLEDSIFRFAVLQSEKLQLIPLTIIKAFKNYKEVVSVGYLLYVEGFTAKPLGCTDEFVVKLKETTTYEQLQELADKNFCTIGEKNQFVQNQFMLYVSKISVLNTMQTANLFYETGLFEYTSPNFILFNAFDV